MSDQPSPRTWDVAARVRPTLFVAALTIAALALPSQVLELYLINAETVRLALFKPRLFEDLLSIGEIWGQFSTILSQLMPILMAVLMGIAASIVLWLSTIHLLTIGGAMQAWSPRQRRLGIALAILIPLAPTLGALLGLNTVLTALSAGGEATGQVTGSWPSDLSLVADEKLRTSVGMFMMVAVALALLVGTSLTLSTVRCFDRLAAVARHIYSASGTAIGLGLIALIVASIIVSPTALSWRIGSQAILNLFLVSLAFILTCSAISIAAPVFP